MIIERGWWLRLSSFRCGGLSRRRRRRSRWGSWSRMGNWNLSMEDGQHLMKHVLFMMTCWIIGWQGNLSLLQSLILKIWLLGLPSAGKLMHLVNRVDTQGWPAMSESRRFSSQEMTTKRKKWNIKWKKEHKSGDHSKKHWAHKKKYWLSPSTMTTAGSMSFGLTQIIGNKHRLKAIETLRSTTQIGRQMHYLNRSRI